MGQGTRRGHRCGRLDARRRADVASPWKSGQKFRRFRFISVAVFRLWQEWQRLWRFLRSVKRAQSPLWSRMWSTSVAHVRAPRFAHSRQKGSRRSWAGRRSFVQISSEYQRRQAAASGERGRGLGLWRGHQPSRVSFPQPGCRQGRGGFIAMGCHLHAKQKRQHQQLPGGKSLALALNALALVDIQDQLCTAGPAVNLQVPCLGIRPDPQQVFVPLTDWTHQPSVLYDQFTMF